MDKVIRKAVKQLMPDDAILYSSEYHKDWEVIAVTDEGGKLVESDAAYAIIYMEDGLVYYVPFVAAGYFAMPTRGVVKEFELHLIPEELLKSLIVKRKNKRIAIAVTVLALYIIGKYIVPPMIVSHRQQQYEQDIATVSNALLEERRKEKQVAYQRGQDRLELNARLAELTTKADDIFVLTNASEPIMGSLSPNHSGIGFGLNEIAAKILYNDNPARDFLENEDKYGYRLMLNFSGDTLAHSQSRIDFSDIENNKFNLDGVGITVTVLIKHTDAEIEKMIADNPNIISREELERFTPALQDGYIRHQYHISAAELTTGKLAYGNINLQNMSFAAKNTYYLISATNARLPVKEQQRLLAQLSDKFNIPSKAFVDCCRWQRVTFQ